MQCPIKEKRSITSSAKIESEIPQRSHFAMVALDFPPGKCSSQRLHVDARASHTRTVRHASRPSMALFHCATLFEHFHLLCAAHKMPPYVVTP